MAEPTTEEIGKLNLPYSRKVSVKVAEFDSGMKMVRLVFREGMRITQIDIDQEAADKLIGLINTGLQKTSE